MFFFYEPDPCKIDSLGTRFLRSQTQESVWKLSVVCITLFLPYR